LFQEDVSQFFALFVRFLSQRGSFDFYLVVEEFFLRPNRKVLPGPHRERPGY